MAAPQGPLKEGEQPKKAEKQRGGNSDGNYIGKDNGPGQCTGLKCFEEIDEISTIEAQANIGTEVSEKLIRYSDNGSTLSAVNFPEVSLPEHPGGHRILHIHHNVPGVLRRINDVFADNNINISGEYLMTNPKTTRLSTICSVTTSRRLSVWATMSPNPTLAKTVTVKYRAVTSLRGWENPDGSLSELAR